MDLPSAVNAYFKVDKGQDGDAMAQVFSTNAVVKDERSVHAGIEAIRAWWLAAKAKYHHVAEPIEMTRIGNRVSVRAEVSGRFPNSPAMLEFVFTLGSNKVTELEIR
ncbi:nuclear transport factor 2 family protein [Indioceanicola profundi]|uniref:nuclear transport factor 2 family protein n=1 Tax=Indioceanicola profundi TaxID=2220096 RepID=UPI000E6AB282|nr:nuclear transport factor 2 family protein [Indioceanicola profundi]